MTSRLLKTLIILPQIGTSELQKIFIHDRTTKVKKEEERDRHRQMMSDYLIKEIKEIKDDEEKGKVKDESLKDILNMLNMECEKIMIDNIKDNNIVTNNFVPILLVLIRIL